MVGYNPIRASVLLKHWLFRPGTARTRHGRHTASQYLQNAVTQFDQVVVADILSMNMIYDVIESSIYLSRSDTICLGEEAPPRVVELLRASCSATE